MDGHEAAQIIGFGREVLEVEMNGLRQLVDQLDESFYHAVQIILAAQGRVILTGMGKSGHVAGKIAATMASTGTPAFFIHSSEAAHGDLGMIQPEDVLIVISNSGETSELIPIIRYCRGLGIRIIGISSGVSSLLMRAADVGLLLPGAKEACFVGVAPTTSTTMTLALGDALAVALMRCKGFSKPDFRDLHPGGKLGLRLMPVSDFMVGQASLPLVRASTPMVEVIIEITSKSYGIAGVVDEAGRLIGSITDGDLRRNATRLTNAMAGDVMNTSPKSVESTMLLDDVIATLNSERIMAVFVTDNGVPVGLVHMHHLFRVGMQA